MHPLLLVFADGTIFYVGIILTVFSLGVRMMVEGKLYRSSLLLLSLFGGILVIVSSTALPLWLYAIWFIAIGYAALASAGTTNKLQFILVFAISLIFVCSEFKYYKVPRVVISKETTIYVIGDSISEGMGERYIYWPDLLAESTGCRVVNLALAGSTVGSAIDQAKGCVDPESLIILEIGGNDLLGDTKPSDFRIGYEELVASLGSDHSILMLELPLYPFKNAYGSAQREIAEKYSASLVPKRLFAHVFGVKGATTDGLHLSQIGHDHLAAMFAGIIEVE